MTVDELIAELQCLPKDAEVHFQYNYNDHWRTQVAPKVDTVELGQVKYSEYHRMPKVVEYDAEDDDDYNTEDNQSQVVIIG